MENVKHAGLVFSLALLLSACVSVPTQQTGNPYLPRGTINSISAESQNTPISLDGSILEGTKYLADRISPSAKVAVAGIESPAEKLSAYIIDSISLHLVNADTFTVIDHFDRSLIQKEQTYQLSGAVSDETAVSIGKHIGSQFIIVGSLLPLGDTCSFRLKILNVETAQILGTRIYQVKPDNTLLALLKPEPSPPVISEEAHRANQPPPQTVINGDVNIINNNETTVNGDVYINAPKGFLGF